MNKDESQFKWWHGLVFYAGVELLSWCLRRAAHRANARSLNLEDRDFYKRQRLPVFAPPGIAFPIAWCINSVTAIAAALRVLNSKESSPERSRFLGFQAGTWVLFATFNAAYFELRSPINAAAVALGYTIFTAASIRSASRLSDGAPALLLLPTAAWLVLANPVGLAAAAWNRDAFWHVGPFARPPRWLLK